MRIDFCFECIESAIPTIEESDLDGKSSGHSKDTSSENGTLPSRPPHHQSLKSETACLRRGELGVKKQSHRLSVSQNNNADIECGDSHMNDTSVSSSDEDAAAPVNDTFKDEHSMHRRPTPKSAWGDTHRMTTRLLIVLALVLMLVAGGAIGTSSSLHFCMQCEREMQLHLSNYGNIYSHNSRSFS
jgi:hypothetical protein